MGLTTIQEGVVGQNEFAKLVIVGSDGRLEVALPMTDDERRDAEIHRRGEFWPIAAWQVKISMGLLSRAEHGYDVLNISFPITAGRLINDPRFWYFLAYLDRQTMAFRDPVFIVDSLTLHTLASSQLREGKYRVHFTASMKPFSHDKWTPYRVRTVDVAQRVLQILEELKKLETAQGALPDLSDLPGVVLVRRSVR